MIVQWPGSRKVGPHSRQRDASIMFSAKPAGAAPGPLPPAARRGGRTAEDESDTGLVFVARHGSAYESDVGQQPEESGRHDSAGPESAGPTPERCGGPSRCDSEL
jgi:hypothetical protein